MKKGIFRAAIVSDMGFWKAARVNSIGKDVSVSTWGGGHSAHFTAVLNRRDTSQATIIHIYYGSECFETHTDIQLARRDKTQGYLDVRGCNHDVSVDHR
jgi:hypothetical protein